MILATAGHIDHGKTALVRALTGVDADRLPEEKRRGLTIDLGFAYTTLPDGTELGFVDVPGHERFLPNMLAGVLSIDRVLLIVAADDGPRPQTFEHLDILALIGVAEVTGVMTKIDRVAPERRIGVAGEVGRLLAAAGYGASPVFAVSSRTGEGIAALAAHLRDAAAAASQARAAQPAAGLFRMPIDRVFTLPGIGPVVTGTVIAGTVAAGDRLCLSPRGIAARVRGVHAQNRPVDRAAAGERCAVNIAGGFAEGAEPGRGDWLLAPDRHAPTARLDLQLRVSHLAEAPLRDGLPVHLHLGTEDIVARLAVLGGRTLEPGETGFVQLDVGRPIGALYGDRAVLRDHAARHTLGGGRVVDPFPPRRGRSHSQRLATLAAVSEPAPALALARLLDATGIVDLAAFALARNLTPDDPLLDPAAAHTYVRAGTARAPLAITRTRLEALTERVAESLAEWHRAQPDALGAARSVLLRRLRAEAPEAALDAAVAAAVTSGRIVRDGAVLRLPTHQPRLTRADEHLWERVRPLIAAGELRPPRVRELASSLPLDLDALEKFLRRVERFGRLARIADNRYFLPETVARLAVLAHEVAAASPEGQFGVIAFRDRSGVGRNLSIEILEYLDAIGVTRRIGDTRIVLRGGEAVFG
ncbi:MAG: selenocysteine-specific translation elongation factor [Alphaproteobacteria bacterium]|nr:selenocysteine-specific translation elongation factor [Alphaproteobacteria bacterium]